MAENDPKTAEIVSKTLPFARDREIKSPPSSGSCAARNRADDAQQRCDSKQRSHYCYSHVVVFRVDWDQDAREELMRLPVAERRAVMNAVAKLEAFGDHLGAPHTSQVIGSPARIRELRPRAGRSPWRALYRRVADTMVILAVGSEAKHDRHGFDRAVRLAEERLKEIEG